MTKTREDEIRESIKLIGWLGTSERITTKEDKEIFNHLSEEEDKKSKAKQDNIS